jgi:hypothetical protein
MHKTPTERLRALIGKQVVVEFPDIIMHPQAGPMYLGTKAVLVDFDSHFAELKVAGQDGSSKVITYPLSALHSIQEAESDLAVKAPIIMPAGRH